MNADPTVDEKGDLLDALYGGYGSGGTPLRDRFNEAGKYLSCEDNDYFGDCPALEDDEGGECQQNFAVVMTDGFYNGSFYGGPGNADGDNDTSWDSANTGPYGDTHSNTLGDIAMEYYETDISSAANNVKPSPGGIDNNTAQHVVTYSVAFGVDGYADRDARQHHRSFYLAPTQHGSEEDRRLAACCLERARRILERAEPG